MTSDGSSVMKHHLVQWIETFKETSNSKLSYSDVSDGIFLNHVMFKIDQSSDISGVIDPVENGTDCLQNWDCLMKNLRAYYNEILQQLILVPLPNVKVIANDDDDQAASFAEIEKVLLLLLGCAVQSENKEHFIDTIQNLDTDTQHSLVSSIKQITDENKSVITRLPSHLVDMEYIDKIYNHLCRVLNERDDYAIELSNVARERDFYKTHQNAEKVVVTSSYNPSPEKQNLATELADTKAKLRHSRQELEDKFEIISEKNEELNEFRNTISNLRNENVELAREARLSRSYCDELDAVKEKLSKVERLEAEISRYQEQLSEHEFLKVRVEELREENDILVESKFIMEEQLQINETRAYHLTELERALEASQHRVTTVSQEKDALQQKLHILTEEIGRLEYERKMSTNEDSNLEDELEEAKRRFAGPSLSEQIGDTAQAKILRLELENRRLQHKLSEHEAAMINKFSKNHLQTKGICNEKLKSQQLNNELEKLSNELEYIGVSKEQVAVMQNCLHENKYEALQNIIHDAIHKSTEIKDEKLRALESRLDESKNNNQRLHEQIRSIKRDNERLKQCYEESLRLSPTEELNVKNNVSSGRTQDIFELKDHLVNVERTNATLLAENRSYETQIKSQIDRLQQVEQQHCELQSQLIMSQNKSSSIQSENTQLKVETSSLQNQCSTLMSKNSGLSTRLNDIESAHGRLKASYDELNIRHDKQRSDQAALQRLYEELCNEYELQTSKYEVLKSDRKSLKSEIKESRIRLDECLTGSIDTNKIQEELERERELRQIEIKYRGNLQVDYNSLRDTHDRLAYDYNSLQQDHKAVKTLYNQLLSKHDKVLSDLEENRNNRHVTEIEITKLVQKCEALDEMNVKVEDDNRQLIHQVQTLLNQNHELLTEALNSKDHFAVEEKAYLEKLAELRRQKEKLEEKIFEQYKKDSHRKKGSFGASLVRKARGLLNKARSRSRPNLMSDLTDFGHVQINDGNNESNSEQRRTSTEMILQPYSALYLNKSLAKSTNALSTESEDDMLSGSKAGEDRDSLVGEYPQTGAMSPLNEVVSLKQFLNESNKSPSSRRKVLETSIMSKHDMSLENDFLESFKQSNGRHLPERPKMPERPKSCFPLRQLPQCPKSPIQSQRSVDNTDAFYGSNNRSVINSSNLYDPASMRYNRSNNNSNDQSFSTDVMSSKTEEKPGMLHSRCSLRESKCLPATPQSGSLHGSHNCRPTLRLTQAKRLEDFRSQLQKRPASSAALHHSNISMGNNNHKTDAYNHIPQSHSTSSIQPRKLTSLGNLDLSPALPATEDQPIIYKPIPVYSHRNNLLYGHNAADVPKESLIDPYCQFNGPNPINHLSPRSPANENNMTLTLRSNYTGSSDTPHSQNPLTMNHNATPSGAVDRSGFAVSPRCRSRSSDPKSSMSFDQTLLPSQSTINISQKTARPTFIKPPVSTTPDSRSHLISFDRNDQSNSQFDHHIPQRHNSGHTDHSSNFQSVTSSINFTPKAAGLTPMARVLPQTKPSISNNTQISRNSNVDSSNGYVSEYL